MLKIGDFSQLAQVSVRALRIYDEMGLLKPVHVDKFSGYRHYETEQLPRLNRIIALKDLGFSLEQISQVLKSNLSAEQLRGMLVLKQSEIERSLKEGQSQLMRVEARLRQIEREGKVSPYEVTVKEIRPVTIASSQSLLATLDEITRVRCGLYTDLYQWLDENHIEAGEPEMAIYDNAAYVETDINMEAAITVGEKVPLNKRRPRRGSRLGEGEGDVRLRQLPGVKTMASVIHHGSIYEVGDSITALYQWVSENGYAACGAYRELHLSGREINCDYNAVTIEMQLPFKKDA